MGQPDREDRDSNTPESDSMPAVDFHTVFSKEVVEIGKRKGVTLNYSVPSSNHGLVGLALSGGGIRSASFNLGILQSMIMVEGRVNVLRLFDYLSASGTGHSIAS